MLRQAVSVSNYNPGIQAIEPNLDAHYRNEVIGGPGSFMMAAQRFEVFADAVRRKLVLEI